MHRTYNCFSTCQQRGGQFWLQILHLIIMCALVRVHAKVREGEAHDTSCEPRTRSIFNIMLSRLPASVMASTALSIQTGHAAASGFEGSHHPDGGRASNLKGQWRTHAAMRARISLALRPRSWPEKGPKGPRHSQTPSGEGTEAKGRRGRKPSGFFQQY